MSLINDALKKVSQAERGKPQAQPVDFEMRAMEPVIYEKRPYHLLWISVALLTATVAVAAFMFFKQRKASTLATPAAVSRQSASQPVKSTSAESKTQPHVTEVALPAATSTAPISPATAAPETPVALTPAQPAPVVPASAGPAFRLKGILYTKNPTALINEASVHVGGEVDGAKVTKIEATTVALDYEGKTITLKLAAK